MHNINVNKMKFYENIFCLILMQKLDYVELFKVPEELLPQIFNIHKSFMNFTYMTIYRILHNLKILSILSKSHKTVL